jgi:SNF2 family DNA or RNA helicase
MIMDGTPINQAVSDIYAPFDFLKPGLLGYKSFMAFQARYEVAVNPNILKELVIYLVKSKDEVLRDEEKFVAQSIYNYKLAVRHIDRHEVDKLLPPRLKSNLNIVLNCLYKNPLFRVGHKNLDELYEKIQPHSMRVLKQDCIDLPDKLFVDIRYDLKGEVKRIYDEMTDNFISQVTSDENMSVKHVLTQYMRLQQILGGHYVSDGSGEFKAISGKNERLELMLDSIVKLSHSTKVIIWARFKSEIKLIYERLVNLYGDESSVLYYGEVNQNYKTEAKRKFKEDENCRFLVGNPQSGGIGLNLISASYMYFYSKDFSLRIYLQAIERFHRPGQLKNCTVVNMVAKGTIDEKISDAYSKKQDIADYVTGDYLRLL